MVCPRRQMLDVQVDDIDADLLGAVTEAGAPRTRPPLRIAHIRQREAAPLAPGRKARDAVATELEGQRHLVPIGVTEHMRAKLAMACRIAAGDLHMMEDRLAEQPIGWAGHRPSPVTG